MKIYHYEQQTGIFWGDIEDGAGITDAKESPLEPGIFLCPAGATFTKPPAKKKGKVRAWINEGWMAINDYVTTPVYFKSTGEKASGGYFAALPDDLTDQTPPSQYPLWENDAWTEDIARCLADIKSNLELLCDQYQDADFEWRGNMFSADKAALNDMASTLLRGMSLKDTSPIPTNNGQWQTNSVDTWVYLTMAELKKLAAEIYDRNAKLWKIKNNHKIALSKLKTVADLTAYDYKQGWDV